VQQNRERKPFAERTFRSECVEFLRCNSCAAISHGLSGGSRHALDFFSPFFLRSVRRWEALAEKAKARQFAAVGSEEREGRSKQRSESGRDRDSLAFSVHVHAPAKCAWPPLAEERPAVVSACSSWPIWVVLVWHCRRRAGPAVQTQANVTSASHARVSERSGRGGGDSGRAPGQAPCASFIIILSKPFKASTAIRAAGRPKKQIFFVS
jgi:hypothetical protein